MPSQRPSTKRPLISVVMPFYNCEHYLTEAIESILDQTFSDFEFIIINDASTDSSDAIVQTYIEKDKRIVYIKNTENKGIVHNLNHWIDIAQGTYIARMDGDDICTLTRLEKQISAFTSDKNLDIVGTFMQMISSSGDYVWDIVKPTSSEDITHNAFLYQTMNHGTILCKRSVLLALKWYREAYRWCEDTDLFMRMFFSWYRGVNIPEYLYMYRIHDNNSVATMDIKKARKLLILQKEIMHQYRYSPSLKEYIVMYGYFVVRVLLPGHLIKKIEGTIKKLLT